MRVLILSAILLATTSIFAQSGKVGFGNTDPKATLDVTGTPAATSVADGIIAPRLTGNELAAKDAIYLAAQTGAQVFVSSAASPPTTKTANVTSPGYYYFDGAVWKSFGYTSSGFVVKGSQATNGTDYSFTISNGYITTSSIVTVSYYNTSNEIISHAISSITAGSFNVQFAAVPKSGGSILYTIVN